MHVVAAVIVTGSPELCIQGRGFTPMDAVCLSMYDCNNVQSVFTAPFHWCDAVRRYVQRPTDKRAEVNRGRMEDQLVVHTN